MGLSVPRWVSQEGTLPQGQGGAQCSGERWGWAGLSSTLGSAELSALLGLVTGKEWDTLMGVNPSMGVNPLTGGWHNLSLLDWSRLSQFQRFTAATFCFFCECNVSLLTRGEYKILFVCLLCAINGPGNIVKCQGCM